MNCSKCGNPIKPNMKFCAKCGTPVPQQPVVNRQNTVAFERSVQQPKPVMPQRPVRTAPQQHKPVVSQNPIQPAPVAHAQPVKPPKTKKRRKKKKNVALRVVAIILVVAVLATGGLFLADTLMYKNETKGEGYITEFPVLKQDTEFLVYDSEKFPAEEYEIKVEQYKNGGILKSQAFRKFETVFTDRSSNSVYNINFPEDGDYRITLTDITSERTQTTVPEATVPVTTPSDITSPKTEPTPPAQEETEIDVDVTVIVIIIEVKVDNDDKEAVDKVDLNSKPGDAAIEIPKNKPTATESETLVATEADFDALKDILENLTDLGHSFEYSSIDENAYQTLLYELSDEYGRVTIYKHIYGEDGENIRTSYGSFNYAPESERDPLNQFGNYYAYTKYPADKFDWIIKNVFNVTPDRNNATIKRDSGIDLYYYDGYYYISNGDGGDAGCTCNIKNTQIGDNNIYTVEYDVMEYDNTLKASYKVKCALKNIDGKRQWSLYSIEQEYTIPEDGIAYNGHYYKLYKDTDCETWEEAERYCEDRGGYLTVISSPEENAAVYEYMASLGADNAYIGLSENTQTGEWTWVTGDAAPYRNWEADEPNNDNGNENYAMFYFDDGTWNDGNFGRGTARDYRYFICEWDSAS